MAEEKIYSAICAVMEDIGAVGKNDVNKTQGFKYRGIDAVMNALSPAMIKHKVFCVPELLEQSREERTTAKGTNLIYSICRMKYRFYTIDGSCIEAVTVGEGMDSGDKATNKAMAIAFKYACFQTFCIPTEELMDDPDKDSPEAGKRKATPSKQNTKHAGGQQSDKGKDEAEKKLITQDMLQGVKKELDRTGLEEKIILTSFGLKKLEDMPLEQYQTCMKKFKATPDKSVGKEDKST